MKHCEVGSYEHTVSVPLPNYYSDEARQMKPTIGIDKCILPEIQFLWSLGIKTYGSCCGHGRMVAMVNVDKEDMWKMLEMDYIGGHNKFGVATFALKTQCGCSEYRYWKSKYFSCKNNKVE